MMSTSPDPRPFMIRLASLSLFTAAVAFLAGCGGSASSEMSGTVTYAGKPLTYGKVNIIDAEGKSQFGEIKPNGTYEVKELSPGPVKITVYNQIPNYKPPGERPTGREIPL